jgi:predicted NUDIX family NTP pyrophosphohydrolase
MTEGEDALEAARREFQEETGFTAEGPFLELGAIKQAGGKVVTSWAFEGDCDPQTYEEQSVSDRMAATV